jgi:hypothetical protein
MEKMDNCTEWPHQTRNVALVCLTLPASPQYLSSPS